LAYASSQFASTSPPVRAGLVSVCSLSCVRCARAPLRAEEACSSMPGEEGMEARSVPGAAFFALFFGALAALVAFLASGAGAGACFAAAFFATTVLAAIFLAAPFFAAAFFATFFAAFLLALATFLADFLAAAFFAAFLAALAPPRPLAALAGVALRV